MKQQPNKTAIEKNLGVSFKNAGLLHTALVHRSFLNESKEKSSNERLEFLGDAVLEFVVSSEIVKKFPDLDEGGLTALRSKLVNTVSLAKVAQKVNLGQSLYISKGEEDGGGRNNPALLADSFEAVVGALFLDQGITACQDIIKKLILPKIQEALTNLKDAKSLLQENVQAQGKRAPIYKVISQAGPDHAKTFIVGVFVEGVEIERGGGKNKKEAEEEAAKKALEKI